MKDPNKIYNRLLDIIGFLVTLGFIICQIIGVLHVSWWYGLFPALLSGFFHVSEDDDSDDYSNNNHNLAI